jgi:NADPH:quinone reductase-like Zn-dependent oxidoreductase
MRAIVFERLGGPEVLQLKHDWPFPKPAAGQALVKEHAAGGKPQPRIALSDQLNLGERTSMLHGDVLAFVCSMQSG